jgi:hypothetical protein
MHYLFLLQGRHGFSVCPTVRPLVDMCVYVIRPKRKLDRFRLHLIQVSECRYLRIKVRLNSCYKTRKNAFTYLIFNNMRIQLGDQITEDEMGDACSNALQNFNCKN